MNNPHRPSSPARRFVSGFSPQLSPARLRVLTLLALGCAALLCYRAWNAVSAADDLALTTIAGSSSTTGLSAEFQNARKMAVSSDGNTLYIADTGNHVVRKVTLSSSTVEVIAGAVGQPGSTGDGSNATQARLMNPSDVALDTSGNLYIADSGNQRIRKITLSTNVITAFSGTGVAGAQDGAAASATFNNPEGLDVDASGNVYVADTGNHRLRRIAGGNVTTLAGDLNNDPGSAGDGTAASNAQFNAPRDVAVDNLNNRIYIADSGNNTVRVIQGLNSSDIISTFAGTGNASPGNNTLSGAATTVDLNNPSGVAIFESVGGSMVYLSDTGASRIRRVNTTNSQLDTIAGSGAQDFDGDGTASGVGARALNGPVGIAVPASGSPVFVMDSGNRRLRKVTLATNLLETVVSDGSSGFSGDGGPATAARLNGPRGVAVDAQGFYIADTNNHVIRRSTLDSSLILTIAGLPGQPGLSGDSDQASLAQLSSPSDVAVDTLGNIYIADTGNNKIRRINSGGVINSIEPVFSGSQVGAAGAQFISPQGIAVDSANNLIIANTGANNIIRMAADGSAQIIAGAENGAAGFNGDSSAVNAASALFRAPTGVAVDSAGSIYVADTGNHKIRKIFTSGANLQIITLVSRGAVRSGFTGDGGNAISARASSPTDVAVDSSGNLYIIDRGNNRIRKVTKGATDDTSVINTVINSQGTIGFSGDGGPGLNAALGLPFHLVLSGTMLYLADTGNNRIRRGTISSNQNPTATITSPSTDPFSVEATSAAGASVPLAATASDPDNDPLTFQWFDNNQAISGATTLTPTVNLSLGQHPLKLTVTDNRGGSFTTATKTVNVVDTTPPVFNPNVLPDVNVTLAQGQTSIVVNYTLPTVTDTVSGPCTISGNPCALTITPPDKAPGAIFPEGETIVTIKATDTAGNMTSRQLRIIVSASGSGGGGGGGTGSYRINAYAGSGSFGTSGNGGSALNAAFKRPSGLAIDQNGNVYLADTLARTVRRVGTDGLISNFAGNGEKGSTGDGGAASQARLNDPTGVAVDSAGNLYIADTGNHVIRKVTNGQISTVAGSFVAGFSGDNGAATAARLNFPTGVAVDSAGNLYIADTGNNRLRRVSNGQISTIAGSGIAGFTGDNGAATSAQLNAPTGVAVSSDGSIIYIADQKNHRVRRVSGNTITTFAGNGNPVFGGDGGQASAASLNQPTSVALDPDNNLVIADTGNDRLRRVNTSSNLIETIAGNGTAGNTGDGGQARNASLDTPTGLAVDRRSGATRGDIFVTDSGNNRVRRMTGSNGAPVACIVGGAGPITISTAPITLVLDGRCSTDPENDTLTYEWRDGATLLGTTPTISPTLNAGAHDITLTVRDAAQSSAFTQRIIVGSNTLQAVINGPASLNSANGGPVQATFDGAASTGNPTTYQWKVDNVVQGATTVTLNTSLAVGSHTIELTVGNGSTTSTATKQVTVTSGSSNGPVACIDGGASQTVNTSGSSAQVTLTSACTTGTGQLTYEWSEGALVLGATASITPTLAVGAHPITLKVTDSQNRTSEITQTVTVQNSGGLTCGDGVGMYICSQGVDPSSGRQGQTLDVTISGSGFQPGATVTFSGDGITTAVQSVTQFRIVVRITIALNAPVGSSNTNRRIITVRNPDSTTVSTGRVFSVFPK
jgi:sugar lactone lactonase YvrE